MRKEQSFIGSLQKSSDQFSFVQVCFPDVGTTQHQCRLQDSLRTCHELPPECYHYTHLLKNPFLLYEL